MGKNKYVLTVECSEEVWLKSCLIFFLPNSSFQSLDSFDIGNLVFPDVFDHSYKLPNH